MYTSTARRMIALLMSLILLSLSATTVNAGLYNVSVTRVGQDIYRDTLSGLIVMTRYCYEYVYYQDAVLDYTGGSGGKIYFDRNSSCDVSSVRKPNARLTRVRSNLYRDDLSGGYVQTSLCLELALSEESLVLSDRVIFLTGGNECDRSL